MRLRLTPRDTAIIDLLVQAGEALVHGQRLLQEVFLTDPEYQADVVLKVREAEHASDEIVHATLRRLNSTFVTPFDREDIYALVSALDDCMDNMEAAADAVVLARPAKLPSGVQTQLAVLQEQAAITAQALPGLHTMKGLENYLVEINRLENDGDEAYRDMLAELFSGAYQPLELLKVREVIDALEDAADAFETVSHHVETIVVKES